MLTRRALGASLLAAPLPLPALGQAAYPNRPIRVVVGFPAGQAADINARFVARRLSEDLGQPVIVENKPGASGIISHEAVKLAAPDGYTLLLGSTGTLAINPALFRSLPYDPLRDFAPVSLTTASPQVLVARRDGRASSLAGMIDHVRAARGQVAYGSSGIGTTSHIAMEMLRVQAGLEMTHVPYRGAPQMMADIIAGRIDYAFDSPVSALPQAAQGHVVLLGSGAQARSARMPGLPTIAEQGFPEFQAVAWNGILAPAGTPAAIIEVLAAATNRALQSEEASRHFGSTATEIMGGTPSEFSAFLRREVASWGTAVRASGAQVD